MEYVSLPEQRATGGLAFEGTSLHFISGLKDRNNDTDTHWVLNVEAENPTWEDSPSKFLRPR